MNGKYSGFPKTLINSLVCQRDFKELKLKFEDRGSAEHIFDGKLYCTQCGIEYPIEDGVLNLLPKQTGITTVMKSEIDARNEQAFRYDKRMSARYYKEVVPTLKCVDLLKDDVIIEYGCGTGRITSEFLKKKVIVLAVDFSLESLNVLKEKLNSGDEIGLVAADAVQFKTSANFFSKALSFQVYEHIPTFEQRMEFLKNIQNTLMPGGVSAHSIYHQDIRRRIRKNPKEGRHKNDIFYHYYSSKEIKSEFGKVFSYNKIKYIDITLPLEARLNLTSEIGGIISRIFCIIPLFKSFAHLLLIKSKK